MARRIPGKQEFNETLRYFRQRIQSTGVKLQLGRNMQATDLLAEDFDGYVLATGVLPRMPEMPGLDHPSVLSYEDVLLRGAAVGDRVAVIGAGGIGFDLSLYLAYGDRTEGQDAESFFRQWGVDPTSRTPGGVEGVVAQPKKSARSIWLLQRKDEKPGLRLGKTTGWIHRQSLRSLGVETLAGVSYERIDGEGLHIRVAGRARVLEVDNVIICAGQEPRRELYEPLRDAGRPVHLIGGADVAVELDAGRAIEQASRLAAVL